jgi:hypothetical protein
MNAYLMAAPPLFCCAIVRFIATAFQGGGSAMIQARHL